MNAKARSKAKSKVTSKSKSKAKAVQQMPRLAPRKQRDSKRVARLPELPAFDRLRVRAERRYD